MSTVLELRLQAAQKADALGLLDAVRTIAQSGGQRGHSEWLKDWEQFERKYDANGELLTDGQPPWVGYRFFYGERKGDHNRPFAEVLVLHYSRHKPVHEKQKPGAPFSPGNPHDAVTGSEVIYRHDDINGVPETVCLREGPWIDLVLAEAKRIGIVPQRPSTSTVLAEEQPKFEPYAG